MEVIKGIKEKEQNSMFYTSHRMEEAEEICDKIAIMDNGKFVDIGTPYNLRETYKLGYEIWIFHKFSKQELL